ncbi:MAG: hypothetical protein ABEJ62_02895 [Candidatus Nanohaloarchaea archaeon]
MYSLRQVQRGLKHPGLAGREVNRLFHTRLKQRDFNTSGVDVFEEDWDVMLVLDACRYDMFEEISDMEGGLETHTSRGSSTIGWLRGNFRDRDLTDTVYVTSNPQLEWNREKIRPRLHAEVNLWGEEWSEEHNTVLPEDVTRRAVEAGEEYPEKRMLVHYMQPHFPFVADEVPEELEGLELEDMFWNAMMEDRYGLSREEVWRLYRENLERALPHVEEAAEEIRGKTVVTADHGNMVGERSSPVPTREWGHPQGVFTRELVEVPWMVLEGERREVRGGESVDEGGEVDEEEVRDRLQALGYE